MHGLGQGQAGETSVERKCRNDELVSLTGQQLIGTIRLFREVPLNTVKLRTVPGEHSIQCSGRELGEDWLWMFPAAMPRWPPQS